MKKKSSLECIFIAAIFTAEFIKINRGPLMKGAVPVVESGSLCQSGKVEFQNVFLMFTDLS